MSENVSNWKGFRPKAKTVGLFAKHTVDHSHSREKLDSFVSEMKLSKKQIQSDLEKEVGGTKFRVRRRSTQPEVRTTRYTDKNPMTLFNQGQDLVCNECEKAMGPFKHTWYPCRVCTRVFHKDCVLQISSIHKSVIESMDRASTNIGWSCHICDDLSLLLTESELNPIIDKFENYDLNRDSSISLHEFIMYNERMSDEPLSASDKERLRLSFRLMDLDQNNTIDWWEFLNHEAKIKLSRRKQDDLVDMLTEKEVVMAKAVFQALDENKDGTITEWEAKRMYKDWYRRFDDKKDEMGREDPSLDLHAESAAQMVMEGDISRTGVITWEDFLAGQALYIICARPNLMARL